VDASLDGRDPAPPQSSFRIVPVAWPSLILAFTAFERLRKKLSFGSRVTSPVDRDTDRLAKRARWESRACPLGSRACRSSRMDAPPGTIP
jgi:hypothetical protein